MKIITTNHPVEAAAKQLADTIRTQLLAGHHVLWLLSGGSSLTIATEAAAELRDIDHQRLHVTLTDERYGPVGHADENWHQLLTSGFDLPQAHLYRPLTGDSPTDTVAHFNHWLETTLAKVDYRVGIFGIGPDGHTAGIKPHSPATMSEHLIEGYTAEDFTRLTITPAVIAQCDEIVIQASGADKQTVLHDVLTTNRPVTEQPAQALKIVPNTTLYTTNTLEES
jgi:6-phosphogluconolactonase/glucosamine-6-phosphate isomerase/deaminase